MTCADLDILLADYVDGTLDAGQRSEVERHLAGCPGCALFARDVMGAVAFVERSAAVEPPPELVNKLLFEVTSGSSRTVVKPTLVRRVFGRLLGPVLEPFLQPRFAMGMAMTVLSFAMLGRFAGIDVRHVRPADLNPVKVWVAAEDRVNRAWSRGVKYYENLRLVFEIQSQLQEWTEEQQGPAVAPAPDPTLEKDSQ